MAPHLDEVHAQVLQSTCLRTALVCVQSYYEEQKREQMQGPVLKRLEEEEQQQQAQALPPAGDHWQGTQGDAELGLQEPSQQPGWPYDESQMPFDQSESAFDEASVSQGIQQPSSLQHNGPRSWASSRHRQQPQVADHLPAESGSFLQSVPGHASGFSPGVRAARANASPKPPLPSRRQSHSSEMAFLGGSAGNSAVGSGSDSDHV